MWIKFLSDQSFAVKIYVGGVNAVSGESAIEIPDTLRRRRERLKLKQALQDYIVSPS